MSNEEIELLSELGLTANEARVYLALATLGPATAKTTAVASKVARERVYGIMPTLRKKGLVEEMLTRPKTFRATPMKTVYSILFKQKKEKEKELKTKAKELLQKHRYTETIPEEPRTMLIPCGKATALAIAEEYEKARESVEATIIRNKLFFVAHNLFSKDFCANIARKGVKIRFITEDAPKEAEPLPDNLKEVDIAFSKNPIPVEFIVFDRKKVLISTTETQSVGKMQFLYSDNPFIVRLALNYFDSLWSGSKGIGLTTPCYPKNYLTLQKPATNAPEYFKSQT
ncbi:MAG: TrmB family transcriptional regulator [Candidatus Bathyarchaeia archaeon]